MDIYLIILYIIYFQQHYMLLLNLFLRNNGGSRMPRRVLQNSSYLNAKSTTRTITRVEDVSCTSGMCPLCVRECPFLCEISLSAFRGREALYPVPEQFGASTASALKDYGLDWSHFNILAALVGAKGVEADSDMAIFPNVDVRSEVAGIPLKLSLIHI